MLKDIDAIIFDINYYIQDFDDIKNNTYEVL